MKSTKFDFHGTQKPMVIRFGTKAFISIEEITGTPIDKLDMNNIKTIFVMLLAGLKWRKHDLTLDDIYDYTDQMAEAIAKENGISEFEGMTLAMEEIANVLSEVMGDGNAPSQQE